MTEHYKHEIAALYEWFKERLANYPRIIVADMAVPTTVPAGGRAIVISQHSYTWGTDSLGEPYAPLFAEACEHWLRVRHYELSYTQVNAAFWRAAIDLGMLTLPTPLSGTQSAGKINSHDTLEGQGSLNLHTNRGSSSHV